MFVLMKKWLFPFGVFLQTPHSVFLHFGLEKGCPA
jgi:hypothetical protein